jgi:hypothetical protein
VNPLVNPKIVSTNIELKSSKGIKISNILEGETSETSSEWKGNCTEKIGSSIDLTIQSLESIISEIDKSSILSIEEKEEQKKLLNNSIEMFSLLRKALFCNFSIKDNNIGVLEYGTSFSLEEFQKYYELVLGTNSETGIELNKIGSEKFKAIIFPKKIFYSSINLQGLIPTTIDANLELNVLKIKVEGEVEEISPNTFTKEQDFYVFEGPFNENDKIEIVFKEESAVSKNNLEEKKILENIWLILSILGAIFLLIVILLIVSKKKKIKAQFDDEKNFKDEDDFDLRVKLVELKEKKDNQIKLKPSRIDFEEEPQKDLFEELEEEPLTEPGLEEIFNVTEEKPLTDFEKKAVKKLVNYLKEKREGLSRKEVFEAVKKLGYSNAVAREVIKKLFEID